MTTIRFTALIVALVPCALASSVSRGSIMTFDASLNGPSESPPNSSPGTGTAVVNFDTTANTMHVHVVFSGLQGATTASHIHSPTPSPGTLTAGVATTTPTFAGFPLGVTSGTYDNTLDMTMASSYNPAFVSANGGTPASAEAALLAGMQAGEAYLNIHTTVDPGGEIRGFLNVVPEPSSLAMVAAGVLGCGVFPAFRRLTN
jgi:hypothetical protein